MSIEDEIELEILDDERRYVDRNFGWHMLINGLDFDIGDPINHFHVVKDGFLYSSADGSLFIHDVGDPCPCAYCKERATVPHLYRNDDTMWTSFMTSDHHKVQAE